MKTLTKYTYAHASKHALVLIANQQPTKKTIYYERLLNSCLCNVISLFVCLLFNVVDNEWQKYVPDKQSHSSNFHNRIVLSTRTNFTFTLNYIGCNQVRYSTCSPNKERINTSRKCQQRKYLHYCSRKEEWVWQNKSN